MTPNPNMQVSNDLNPQEIEVLSKFTSAAQEHPGVTIPEIIQSLGLSENEYEMLNRLWSKIETSTREHAESTSGN